MARYAQLHTDDGLAVIKAGLAKEFVLALTFIAQHEDEAIPVREYQKAVKKLAEIGVEITLQRAIGKTLSDNARSKRYYEKTQDKRKNSHVRNDVKPNVESHKNPLHSPSPNAPPTEKRAAAPRYASSKTACLEQWNAAITEVTGTPSCVTGAAMATKAQQFHRVVYGNAETFADVVRRRRLNGQSLNLHWTMNDYANDIERSGPKTAKTQTQEEWFASIGIPHHSQVRR